MNCDRWALVDFALRSELGIHEREAGELVLVDAAHHLVSNRCEHWILLGELRIEVVGIAWIFLCAKSI